jgi:hypothetical protein
MEHRCDAECRHPGIVERGGLGSEDNVSEGGGRGGREEAVEYSARRPALAGCPARGRPSSHNYHYSVAELD